MITCCRGASKGRQRDSVVVCASIQPDSCSKKVLPRHEHLVHAVHGNTEEAPPTAPLPCCDCRRATDPGSAGRALNEGGPGQQRTGKPMKLGSDKFDIPTVRSSPVADQQGDASNRHACNEANSLRHSGVPSSMPQDIFGRAWRSPMKFVMAAVRAGGAVHCLRALVPKSGRVWRWGWFGAHPRQRLLK